MIAKAGLRLPRHSISKTAITSRRSIVKCSYIPNYRSPDPGNLGSYFDRRVAMETNEVEFEPRIRFWEYSAPTADIGSPEGYELETVGIPEYGDGNSGGNSGRGWGGGGGGGSGGDPMKGFTYLFALLLFFAGLFAYIRKGSSKSLLISSACSLLLLVSASLMGHPTLRVGTLLALATCLGLAGAMGYRAKESGKVAPAGLVAVLSALMSVGYVATLV